MRVPAVALAGERSSACWIRLVVDGVEGGMGGSSRLDRSGYE